MNDPLPSLLLMRTPFARFSYLNTLDAPMNHEQSPQDQQHQKIAQAAYYKAMEDGFPPGRDLQYWLEAQREIEDAEIDVPQSLPEG